MKIKKDAYISRDQIYRYWLSRIWDDNLPLVGFIGLNPSTADHKLEDPTIIRCINFARKWNMGGLIMLNLFALRSTNPEGLYKHSIDPIGPKYDLVIIEQANRLDLIVAAWGNHGSLKDRDREVQKFLKNKLHALHINKTGSPKHPLYVKADINQNELIKIR